MNKIILYTKDRHGTHHQDITKRTHAEVNEYINRATLAGHTYEIKFYNIR